MELKELISDFRAKDALRIGDVYSTLFEHYARAGEN
jgi:pentatricopeptide repeat protein